MSKQIIKDILREIDKTFREDPKSIHLLNGMFGSGKSAAITTIIEEIKKNHNTDGIIILKIKENYDYLTDIISEIKLFKRIDNTYEKIELSDNNNELSYNRTHFREILDNLEEKDKDLANAYSFYKICRSAGEKFILDLTDPQDDMSVLIDDYFPNKADKRLLNNTEDVCSESLIVDLMSIYYPLDSDNPKDMKELMPVRPCKIVFIIDDYELYGSSINSWLIESFLDYVFNKTFSEFINYEISDSDERIRVSQFFDFRSIIASREDISKKKANKNLDNYKERIKKHLFKKFSKKEVEDFLSTNKLKINTDIDNLLSISLGLPGLLLLWSEYYLLDDIGDDTSVVYNKAALQILANKSDKEKEWIRCASFLDEFDIYGLRCFPELNKESELAFKYFNHFKELALDSGCNGFLKLREEVSYIISRSISSKSERMNDEYQKIADVYQKAKDLYKGMNDQKIEVFRNLAYFKKFEKKQILKVAFDTDYSVAIKFINDHLQFFDINKFTMSLKKDVRKTLDEFNKRIDLEKYNEKKEFIKSICDDYTKDIRESIVENDDKIQYLTKELKDIKVNLAPRKTINENLQRQYIDKENERIELKKKLSNLNYKSNLFSSAINLGLALLIFFMAYYLPDFYDGVGMENDSRTVETMLFIISGVFAIVSFIYAIRSISSKMKKNDRIKAEKRLKIIEQEKTENHSEMKKLKEENIMSQNRIKEIEKKLEALRSENSDNRAKLSEEFV
jgi:hypothetical protein